MLRKAALTGLVFSLLLVYGQDLGAQERKGFIIGFGIGPGVNILSDEGESESDVGLATDFKIGAQVNESVQVYFLNRVVFWKPEFLDGAYGGISAVGVTYVLPSSPKIQLSGGIGVSTLAIFFDGGSDSASGFGLTAGFGYEFADLWLIDAAVTYGRPSESGESLSMFDIRAGISILSH